MIVDQSCQSRNSGINLLKILFGVKNAKELSEKFPEVKDLQSLMDEAYLKKKGAVKKLIDEMIKSSTNRKVVKRGVNSGKDIVIKSGEVVFPESFILSLSYMPGADAFAYPRYARSNPSARSLLRFFTRLSKEEPPRSLMVRTITTTKPKTGLAAPSTRQGTSLRRIQTSSR
jgi:hypothetical protein